MTPKNRRVGIGLRDLDGMTRMGAKEAGAMRDSRAYTSVIDAIINREAAQSYFGRNTQEILNKRTRKNRDTPPVYHFTPLDELPYEEDEEGFPLDKKWPRLPKRPYHEETRDLLYLAQLQAGGRQSVPGKPTNYLNRRTAGKKALETWAKDSASWPVVGSGRWTHSFGVPYPDPVPPDAEVYLEPDAQERLQTHFPQRYAVLPSLVDVAPPRAQSPITRPRERVGSSPGAWLSSLYDKSVVGLGPNPSRFDPLDQYPQANVTVVRARRR
jgi:hypothetical protein